MTNSAEPFADRLSPDRLETMTDYERIVFYELLSLPHARRSGDRRLLAEQLSNAGLAYANEHRYAEALVYVGEAEAIFGDLGDLTGLAMTALNAGVAYADGGQLHEAERHLVRAFEAAMECGDQRIAAIAANDFVMLFRRNRIDTTSAVAALERIEYYAKDVGLPFLAVSAARALGESAARSGRLAASTSALSRALVLACQVDDPQWIEIADLMHVDDLRASPALGSLVQRLRAAVRTSDATGYEDEADEYRRRLHEILHRLDGQTTTSSEGTTVVF